MINLPEGLTRYHIESAVKRGDHQIVYHGGVVNIDELWKMILENEGKEEPKQDDKRSRFKRISEQSEESI